MQSKGGFSRGDDAKTSRHKKEKNEGVTVRGQSVSQYKVVQSLGDRGETPNCLARRNVRKNIPDTEGNKAPISATTIETKPKPHKTRETR